jgi:hypothetical protein
MARLATFLRRYAPDQRAVAVFNGDMVASVDAQSQLKATILAPYFAEHDLKYAAINLGEKDLALGIPTLSGLQTSYTLPFLCGNLTDSSGNRPFLPFVQRENGSETMTIIGALSPHYASDVAMKCPGYSLGDVEPILDEAKRSWREGQPAVLLYHGPKAEAVEIAKGAPWLSAIVFAHSGDMWVEPSKQGNVWLMDAGEDGKFVGEFRLSGDSAPAKIALGPEFADDKPTEGIREMYVQELKARGFLGYVAKLPTPNKATYVGTAACANCHKKANAIWAKSKHSHAYGTLGKVKHDYDPECVGCHTVGYAYASGFASPEKTPKLKNVGCESCHGPGSRHRSDPTVKIKAKGDKFCRDACHTIENSPKFSFRKYWPKIKH